MNKLLCRLAALAVLAVATRAGADFGPGQFLDPTPLTYQWNADLVETPDGALHAVYNASRSSADGTYLGQFVYYVRSVDGGATWSAPVQLATTWGFAWADLRAPKLVVDAGGVIHVTYNYLNYYGWGAVYAMRSADGGQTWTSTYLNGGCFPWHATPDLGPGGEVYAMWDRWQCLRSNIPTMDMFGASFDGGLTWSVREALPGGTVLNAVSEARSLSVDDRGVLHAIGGYGLTYARSSDRGATFTPAPVPAGFRMTGLTDVAGELLSAGGLDGKVAFIRSRDGGDSWEGPFQIANVAQPYYGGPFSWPTFTQILSDAAGGYFTTMAEGGHWTGPQSLYASSDHGASWSAPEYVGVGHVMKLLFARDGSLVALGAFPDPAGSGSQWVGLKRWTPPAGVDAPDYLSLWEKAQAVYGFRVFGTGTATASFPAEDVRVEPDAVVTVGGIPVAATVAESNGRVLVSFAVDAADWTECRVPITVLKGTVEKFAAIQRRVDELESALVAAAEAEDAETAAQARDGGEVLRAALSSIEREFQVELAPPSGASATDQTSVLVYDQLQSLYAHFKANPPEQPGAQLVLLGESLSVGPGEPFRIDVRVTHLTRGQTAQIAMRGAFEVIELQEAIEAGARTSSFTLFYPPTFIGGTDTVTIDVTVDGTTVSAPVSISVR